MINKIFKDRIEVYDEIEDTTKIEFLHNSYYKVSSFFVKFFEKGDVIHLKAGLIHNKNGPAVEFKNGYKEWWINGKLHRTNGPAYKGKHDEQWFINGKAHRINGPALVSYHNYKCINSLFVINDKVLSKDSFFSFLEKRMEMLKAQDENNK